MNNYFIFSKKREKKGFFPSNFIWKQDRKWPIEKALFSKMGEEKKMGNCVKDMKGLTHRLQPAA